MPRIHKNISTPKASSAPKPKKPTQKGRFGPRDVSQPKSQDKREIPVSFFAKGKAWLGKLFTPSAPITKELSGSGKLPSQFNERQFVNTLDSLPIPDEVAADPKTGKTKVLP